MKVETADFTPIEKHQLNPDEPPHALAVFAESTGDWNEFLFLTTSEGDDGGVGGIALSPLEAEALIEVIKRWLWVNPAARP